MNTKPQSEEYRAFESILGTVLSVSKKELDARIEQEKSGKRSSKAPASRVPVSHAKRD